MIDIVDESGKVLRSMPKTEAHKHGWLHATVIGYLRYGDDWALVRQTADRQEPGQLVASVGGHVRSGESYEEALLREAEEEIGTSNISYKLIGKVRFHRQIIGRDENHLFIIYEISTSDKITLGSEAVAIERFSPEAFKETLANSPKEFGDSCYFVLEHFYPSYLPKSYKKRWKPDGTG